MIADSPRIQAWMHERSGLPVQEKFHGIARERQDRIVAAFGYDSFQPAGCQLHLCVDAPDGLNRELLWKAFSTPFEDWNYHYLLAMIQADNVKSLNMADRLGFTGCGGVPGQLRFGVMYKANCRWLRLPELSNERRRSNSEGPRSK